jgi:hypothetical protein
MTWAPPRLAARESASSTRKSLTTPSSTNDPTLSTRTPPIVFAQSVAPTTTQTDVPALRRRNRSSGRLLFLGGCSSAMRARRSARPARWARSVAAPPMAAGDLPRRCLNSRARATIRMRSRDWANFRDWASTGARAIRKSDDDDADQCCEPRLNLSYRRETCFANPGSRSSHVAPSHPGRGGAHRLRRPRRPCSRPRRRSHNHLSVKNSTIRLNILRSLLARARPTI